MESELRERLRKIENLFSGTASVGEKQAAAAAKRRIIEKLNKLKGAEKVIEIRAPIADRWSRHLFVALCRRYGIEPYRYARQRNTSIMIKAPKSFIDEVLWPEYLALNGALNSYLSEITEKVIREEIHSNTSEPKETEEIYALNEI